MALGRRWGQSRAWVREAHVWQCGWEVVMDLRIPWLGAALVVAVSACGDIWGFAELQTGTGDATAGSMGDAASDAFDGGHGDEGPSNARDSTYVETSVSMQEAG